LDFLKLPAPAFGRWAEWFSFTPATLTGNGDKQEWDCRVVARLDWMAGKSGGRNSGGKSAAATSANPKMDAENEVETPPGDSGSMEKPFGDE
jgi:hypothetical protein